LILAVVLGLGAFVAPACAGDPIVVNAQTGLALSGYDPVAYFTESKPKQGRAEMEWSRDGVVWRFANEGNKAAFGDNPDVYTPRFGGYDPVAVARGVSVPGHPLFWAVIGERLYLFYDDAARAAFVADPGRIIETAERRWPEVVRTVSR
jgi:YHS domain-containing protein